MAIDNFRRVDFTLDKANDYIIDDQLAKVGDIQGRDLVVQITNAGVIQNQPDIKLMLSWRNKNVGNSGMTDFKALDSSQGVFIVTFPDEMNNAGNVVATIGVNEADKWTFSRNFIIKVEENSFTASAPLESDDWATLLAAIYNANHITELTEQKLTEFIEKSKEEWAAFVEANREILESVDPGGVLLSEIVAARKSPDKPAFRTLSERLDDIEKQGFTNMYFPKLAMQEDIALLNLADKWVLIDTGDDRDWANLKPFILAHTDRIDMGIISHYHRDHFGNAINVIQDKDIKTTGMTWYAPPMPEMAGMDIIENALKDIQAAAAIDSETVIVVDSDLKIELNSLTSVQFLNTSKDSYQHYYEVGELSYNNYSMVALIKYDNTELFFSGDIQDGAINWIMAHYADYMHPFDFFKINHHGTNRSNNATFYPIISPKYGLASCSHVNYINADGTQSTELNLLSLLGTQVSYGFKSSSSYVISRNGVKPLSTNRSLRGTTNSAKIEYYIQPHDPIPAITDGSKDYPFVSLDEAMSYAQPSQGIEYIFHFMAGVYPSVTLINQPYAVQVYVDKGATFESLEIRNCLLVDVWGDIHTNTIDSRSIAIYNADVVFHNTVSNDDTNADISGEDKSVFLFVSASNVSVAKIISTNRSASVYAYNGASVGIYGAEGEGNLYGYVAVLGTIYINNIGTLHATTQSRESGGGRVNYDIPWSNLTTLNGFESDALQICAKGNMAYIRGSVSHASFPIGNWVNFAELTGYFVPRDKFTYRFASVSSNGMAVPMVVQGAALKLKTGGPDAPDLLTVSCSYPLF